MRNKLLLVLRNDEEDDGRKGKAVAGVNIDFPTWVKVTQIEYKTAGEPVAPLLPAAVASRNYHRILRVNM